MSRKAMPPKPGREGEKSAKVACQPVRLPGPRTGRGVDQNRTGTGRKPA